MESSRRVLVLALVLACSGCGYVPIFDPLAARRVDHPMGRPAEVPERRVVLISVDGLAPRILASEETPVLSRLAAEGVSAAEAVTIAPSITLPSHVSMLSGVGPAVHGVSWNRYQPWSEIGAPTIFSRCAEEGLRCDLFVSKRKFVHFAKDEPGVRHYFCTPAAADVLASGLASLEHEDPDLVVMHLSELDSAGHLKGWGGEEQRAALREIDRLLGEFVSAALAASARPLTVLVTADHGGYGRGHLANLRENRRIPWILWGDGVDTQAELRWISTLDTAPTLSALLGMAIPEAWVGQPQALSER